MLNIYKQIKSFVYLNKLQKENIDILNKKILNKDYKLVETKCPICSTIENKTNDELISNRDRFGINIKNVICKNCGLIRHYNCLDENSLENFYKNEYRKIYTGKTSSDLDHLNNIFVAQYETGKKYYNLIKKFIDQKSYKNVLEVGCSCGGILSYFQNQNFKTSGLDYDKEYIEFGKSKGLDLSFGGIEKIKDKKFDIIILSHVFEHISDLKKFINTITLNLSKDGIIFIAVPGIYNKNYYSIKHIRYNYKKILFLYYLQNAHIYSFSKKTLSNFFKLVTKQFKVVFIDEEINCILKLNSKAENKDLKFDKNLSNDYFNFKFFYYINYLKFLLISFFLRDKS